MIIRRALSIPLVLGLVAAPAAAQQAYRDPRRPVADRVADLLGRMTLEEKFWQLFMIPGDRDDSTHDYQHGVFGLQVTGAPATAADDALRINAIQRSFVEGTRLGIPIIPFDEAVHGLMRPGATVFPQAIALAATWDSGLVARVAQAIARETRSRGIRQVLSPVLNIANDVRWGRVEETYGEDPYLASVFGAAFVAAFERAGVVTTPKHFVANVGDGGRDSYPIDVNERRLQEVFYPPFAAAVRAGARSIMTAYNAVDGIPATQNRRLLTDELKRGWGFTGFVISDAAATGGPTVLHLTEPSTPVAAQHALEAGLDVIFQSSYPQYRPYWDAFRRGLIADSVIDAAVRRVLTAKMTLGLFEQPYADPDSAARWNGAGEHRALARESARAAMVLLRNERGTLPLAPAVRSVAVIGTDAVEARTGGYSGPGVARVSMLDAIRARLASGVVRYAPGPGRVAAAPVVVPVVNFANLRGEYFASGGFDDAPDLVRPDSQISFSWSFNAPGRGLTPDWYAVRWTGTLRAPASGARHLGIEGSDGYRLYVDGRLLLDRWRKRSAGTTLAAVTLAAGRTYDLRLEFHETTGNARLRLVWDAGAVGDARAAIDSAAQVARASDVAIVVAGIEEGEFRDRAFLGLPGRQVELIEAVAATGRPVVVVLVGGSAITMPWLERVGAVLHVWYPGDQGGAALADVLFGDHDPGGRLPITFPIAEGQLPLVYNHHPSGRGDDYVDLTGQPLFPLGFGLSYTTFAYSALRIEPAAIGPADSAVVRVRVRNTGTRAGDEVVQLYVRDVLASVTRPVLQLAGFARIHLAPGEEREVAIRVGPDRLRLFDRDGHWVVEPGVFRVYVGSSSKDLHLRGEFTVR